MSTDQPLTNLGNMALLGQFANTTPSTGIHPLWLVAPILLALVATLLCCWLAWRVRSMVRVVAQLKNEGGEPVELAGSLSFLPRFKMRTLLILFTVAAVLLGMFAVEFSRARRQEAILERLAVDQSFSTLGGTHYRLGILGNSEIAGLICDWVNPHFGCDLTHMSLDYYDATAATATPTDDLGSLSELSDLECLQINDGRFSREHLTAIARLPKLQSLSLPGTRLPRRPLEALTEAHRLTRLDLDRCNLTDEDLAEISHFENLTHLTLSHNDLTDDALADIAKLRKLQVLVLANNYITGDGLVELLALPELTDLDLSETQIASDALPILVEFLPLEYVNLSNCHELSYRKRREYTDQLQESRQLRIEWNQPYDPVDQWDFYSNRPSSSFLRYNNRGNGYGFGSGGFF